MYLKRRDAKQQLKMVLSTAMIAGFSHGAEYDGKQGFKAIEPLHNLMQKQNFPQESNAVRKVSSSGCT
jgi:hypothetical protein